MSKKDTVPGAQGNGDPHSCPWPVLYVTAWLPHSGNPGGLRRGSPALPGGQRSEPRRVCLYCARTCARAHACVHACACVCAVCVHIIGYVLCVHVHLAPLPLEGGSSCYMCTRLSGTRMGEAPCGPRGRHFALVVCSPVPPGCLSLGAHVTGCGQPGSSGEGAGAQPGAMGCPPLGGGAHAQTPGRAPGPWWGWPS